MLNIDPKFLIGKKFYGMDPGTVYSCIGTGIGSEGTSAFVVGVQVIPQSNGSSVSKVSTFLFKNVTFASDVTQ